MKVLQPGVKFHNIRLTCSKCGARLEAGLADIKRYYYADYFERQPTEDYPFVTCPQCDAEVAFSKASIPDHIYRKLPIQK